MPFTAHRQLSQLTNPYPSPSEEGKDTCQFDSTHKLNANNYHGIQNRRLIDASVKFPKHHSKTPAVPQTPTSCRIGWTVNCKPAGGRSYRIQAQNGRKNQFFHSSIRQINKDPLTKQIPLPVDETPINSPSVSNQAVVASQKPEATVIYALGEQFMTLSTWGAVFSVHLALGSRNHSKSLVEFITRIHVYTGVPCETTLYSLAIFRKLWSNGANLYVALTEQRNYEFEELMELENTERLIAEVYYWSLWVGRVATLEEHWVSWSNGMKVSVEASSVIKRAVLKDLDYQVIIPSEELKANLLEFATVTIRIRDHATPDQPFDCRLILNQIYNEYRRASA